MPIGLRLIKLGLGFWWFMVAWFPGLRFDTVPFRVSRGLGFGNGFRERGWLNMVYGCRGFRVDLGDSWVFVGLCGVLGGCFAWD